MKKKKGNIHELHICIQAYSDSGFLYFLIYQFSQYVREQLGSQLVDANCIVRSFSQGSVVGDVQVELAAESQSVADGLAVTLSALSTNIDQNLSANGQTLVASISAEGKSKIQPFFTSHSSLKGIV